MNLKLLLFTFGIITVLLSALVLGLIFNPTPKDIGEAPFRVMRSVQMGDPFFPPVETISVVEKKTIEPEQTKKRLPWKAFTFFK